MTGLTTIPWRHEEELLLEKVLQEEQEEVVEVLWRRGEGAGFPDRGRSRGGRPATRGRGTGGRPVRITGIMVL